MDIRSSVLVMACCGFVAGGAVSCAEETETSPGVSAQPKALVKSAEGWPDVIVAERNQFLPEGVEYDQARARFLVGSLREGSVYLLERDGSLTTFVEDPDLVSSVGIEIDQKRGRLLVANSDSSIFGGTGTGQAKLGVFDLNTGARLAMVDLAATLENRTAETIVFANDVTVDDRGTIYISDTRARVIYRVDQAYRASVFHRFEQTPAFAPNGLVYHPSGYLLIAGGESLYKLSLDHSGTAPASASQVRIPEPISGADGMVWRSDGQLAIVANKINRVVVLKSTDEWSSAELVGTAAFEVMATTVAVVGDELYVVHPHFRDEGVPSVERVEVR